jgi:oxygen-independent coproporphyrinogen-3 oxidase
VIHRIICTLHLDFGWVETEFGIDPREHFADALEQLRPMADDGLVEFGDGGLSVTPRGRFFLRNLCMPFDAYLGSGGGEGPKYSRTV